MALLMFFAAVPVFAQSFYEARFQSGVIDFNRGAFARAVDELRIAAFGRVDDIPSYEIAEIYLALANDRLDRLDDAHVAALKVVQAEQVSPSYANLALPPDIRTAFEQLLPALLTKEELSHAPAFERFAAQAAGTPVGVPRASRHPRPVVPTPTKRPNVAVTVGKNDNQVAPPQPALDYGRLALESVAAGDEAAARRYADLAFAQDETNPDAHTALAQIGRSHNAWNEVAEHYAIVRTRRRLTDDEAAAYVIALVNSGRVADAMGVRRSLPASVLDRPDVRKALQPIEPKPAPQSVAPVPRQVTPVPQPVRPAPQPVAPAPQPIAPAPQPVAPTPRPVAPAPQPVAPAPQPVAPAPQPAAPAPQPVAPAPQPVAPSPQPVAPAPAVVLPVAEQIAEAAQMIEAGNIVGARSELRRIATNPNLQRSDRQALAAALSQTALYAESSAQYRKTYPLKAGEEIHMFYEAVNRYELGNYELARQLITRAMPALPQTPAILAYRDRIMAQQ